MPGSMTELIRNDLECEGLLDCLYGLPQLDRTVFEILAEHGDPMIVDEVAAEIDRERSTAYRSLERLVAAGFLDRRRESFETGSYVHVYSLRDPGAVAAEMQRLVTDWYAEIGPLIREFEERFAERATAEQ